MFRHSVWLGVALAGACALMPSGTSAEPTASLEQDYAQLCAGKPEPATETCAALKSALLAKLSAPAKSPVPAKPSVIATPPAENTPDQAGQEELRQRWGVYADMVGKTYFGSFDDGSYPFVAEYSWEMPGESIVATLHGATKTGEIVDSPGCGPMKMFRRLNLRTNQVRRTIAKPCWPQLPASEFAVQADGSVIETEIKGKYRDIIKRRPDGTFRWVREERKRGGWERLGFGSTTSHERTPQFLASLRDKQRRVAAAQQQQQAGDSIVGRTLGGALMGAVLGGGGQNSVDLAVAGAQAAAQGGNTLEVLNSMGDVAAVKSAESARQLDEAIARGQAEERRKAAEEEARRQAEAESARKTADAKLQAEATVARDNADQAARAEREAAEAERIRLADAAREKAKADKARKEADDLAARERAASEARQRIEQQKRQDESALRSSFSGRASTCAGGGSGVLYLQTSRPPKQGCNVQFEARCPGTQPGNGVRFGQNNYIGGSCMGIGDAIQIGPMACPAEQVMVQMTGASCS